VQRNARAHAADPVFAWVCRDVLGIDPPRLHGRMLRVEGTESEGAALATDSTQSSVKRTPNRIRKSSVKDCATA
jgi:hypothetical protein